MTNKKYNLEEIKKNISDFIANNISEDGIDLDNLYFGKFNYNGTVQGHEEDASLADKIALVYLNTDCQDDSLYVDLFRGKVLETSYYIIPGVLSMAPFVRRGLTVDIIGPSSKLLEKTRMPLDDLHSLFEEIQELSYNEFLAKMTEKNDSPKLELKNK